MKYLLLGGTTSTGKSTAIWNLAQNFVARGFNSIGRPLPITFVDFTAIFETTDRNGNTVRILLNSPTDDPTVIIRLKEYIDSLDFAIDIFISSVRDPDWWPRRFFFNTFSIDPVNDFLLEIPLGRIHRIRGDYQMALDWYRQSVDNLMLHTLANPPFDI
jgi:hypothetical protein